MTKAGKQTHAKALKSSPLSTPDPRFTDWEDYRGRSVRPAKDFVAIALGLRGNDLPVEKRKDFD